MSPQVAGQRCVSEREPELGLGIVASVDAAARRIAVEFAAAGERRLYALDTGVLQRVVFRVGETVATRTGAPLPIEQVEEAGGLLTYLGGGRRVPEAEIANAVGADRPAERLMAGQTDPAEVFELRYRAARMRARIRASDVRGFLGGRVELIPHQFHILQEVAARQVPRVLLADEVGLGKTIEAGLILQHLLTTGRAARVLVLVPEPLVHQWFVELWRRFNLWFGLYDEERCQADEAGEPGRNPFLGGQWAIASVAFLAGDPARQAQALAAGWDLVVVDEAHHLVWTPEAASPEYALVEALAQRMPGLLLLTATPTQLGLTGHFARLRLLDPARHADYAAFLAEVENYGAVAGVADKILADEPLTAADRAALGRIFHRDPERLAQHLAAWAVGRPGAREELLRTLLDQHGTGRVMFRNTRTAMAGFPPRRYCPARIELAETPVAPADDLGLAAGPHEGDDPDAEEGDGFAAGARAPVSAAARRARSVREWLAEETGRAAEVRYAFRGDPRIEWLAELLLRVRPAKVLLICRSPRKVLAIEAALRARVAVKTGVFHEGLPLVQRDRQAAWFAEPDGAQLLLCSEIGSEGRNFQFAHHLVLFDLPLDPGLIEQRIGRLDRIGQTAEIQLHVPFLAGGAEEILADWYHRGLEGFTTPLHGGHEYRERFRARLLALLGRLAEEPAPRAGAGARRGRRAAPTATVAAEAAGLIAETVEFRAGLTEKMRRGRDRLLELNSFHPAAAEAVLARVRAAEADPALRELLFALLDHFGVRLREYEGGEVGLDPSHAYIEAFPSIPADGMLATFDRRRALVREDIRFLSADHPLVRDALDLLLGGPAGTTAFGFLPAAEPALLLETVFVLEAVAEARWQADRFLPPQPLRLVVDATGADRTAGTEAAAVAAGLVDGPIQRFLERPGFSARVVQAMVTAATALAEARATELRRTAQAVAAGALTAERQRLEDLRRLNDHVRPEEIALAEERRRRVDDALAGARLRLDAVRLIVAGPGAGGGESVRPPGRPRNR